MSVKPAHVAAAVIIGDAVAHLVPTPTFTALAFQTGGLLIAKLAYLAYQGRIATSDQHRPAGRRADVLLHVSVLLAHSLQSLTGSWSPAGSWVVCMLVVDLALLGHDQILDRDGRAAPAPAAAPRARLLVARAPSVRSAQIRRRTFRGR